MKLIIAAGGTGGHLFPGIAIAKALKKRSAEHQVSFIGLDRELEKDILKREGFSHQALEIGRIKGEGLKQRFTTFMSLPKAYRQAAALLEEHQPDVVLGIGGYSSGPVILAAMMKRIPRAILEPNAIPGFTNRMLGPFSNRIFVSFPEASRFFSKKKVKWTGTPVRHELTQVGINRITALNQRSFTILVLGGSQGATAINKAVVALLPAIKESGHMIRFIHQTGERDYEWVRSAYRTSGIAHEVTAFLRDMPVVYKQADLTITRAGASTIAELIETKTPAILVPYPFAADDHQKANAMSLVRTGAAEMILNNELEKNLAERIFYYEGNRDALEKMTQSLKQLGKNPASEAIVEECLKLNVPNA
ncbi:MAG: undecaprenyldiphospho-muramoylpentapeptide beta-N-acetylglucosaminyltransferase [Deltaproteobacteria bacterium]|nr:undecaprenyldiphospho-muramoylpentapeptide beta-N-acetylglucosaminyltransferase [Deltaproteobacteria bacterium]